MYSRVVDMIDEIRGDKNCIGELEFILNKDLDGLMTALRREIKAKEVDYSIRPIRLIGLTVSHPKEEHEEHNEWKQLELEFAKLSEI